jgi:serine/threonine-protein kinase
VLAPFAQGATGSLYLADESETGRRGLLKILSSVPKHREPERARLRRELTKQATLTSSRLVVPWASGETEGSTWLFRPWLDGVSLRVRLAQSGGLPREEALSIAAQVTIALDELHRGGLLHRDVKPGHVFLQTNGSNGARALLIDPGLCGALLRPGNSTILGTPGYVAPEQLQGKLVSFRSDLYSLGCVMYEMLAGYPPFVGETEQAVLTAQLSGELPALPPDLPEGIVAVLRSLLAREPQERPFSAQKLRRVLEPYAPDGTPMTRPPTTTFGTLPDPEKPEAKPAPGPSLPPPPPSEALRASKASDAMRASKSSSDALLASKPADAHNSAKPGPRPSGAPPPRPPARPTTRGLAPPPPPRVSADETQQLDLEQLELIAEGRDSAEHTQELTPEHLFDVKAQAATAPASARPAARERDDHTVPVRLDQVLAIAPARLRASAAPPVPHEHVESPLAHEPARVMPAASLQPAAVHAAAAFQAAPATGNPFEDDDEALEDALISQRPAAAQAPVEPHQTMFVADAHEVIPAPGQPSEHVLPAPSSALFGALPTQPEVESNPFASLADDDDDDAEKTTVSHKPLAPYADSPASFAHLLAGDDDPTTALPAPSGLSPNTIDDNEEAALGSRHLQDTLHPYLAGTGTRRKLMYGAAAAALLGLGVLSVRALVGSDDPKLATRDVPSAAAPGTLAPPPPIPTVEPTPSVTALAAAPKGETAPKDETVTAQAEMPSADPAPSTTAVRAEAIAAAPAPAPVVESPVATPVATTETKAPAAESSARSGRDDRRQQRREEKARAEAEKEAKERAAKEAKAAAKQSKAKKASTASSDRTAKWNEAVEEARAHYAAKRYKQAAQSYERATQFDPTSDRTFSGLGTARFKAGDFKGAAAAYQRAVQLSPSNSVYHTSLARTYQQMGDASKAKASYKRAVALDPKNEGAKKSLKELGG